MREHDPVLALLARHDIPVGPMAAPADGPPEPRPPVTQRSDLGLAAILESVMDALGTLATALAAHRNPLLLAGHDPARSPDASEAPTPPTPIAIEF